MLPREAEPVRGGDARDDASRRREMIEAFGRELPDYALEARAFASDEARRAAELAEAHGEGTTPRSGGTTTRRTRSRGPTPRTGSRTRPRARGGDRSVGRSPRRRWARATASRSIQRETFPNPIPRSRSRRRGAWVGRGRANPPPPRLLPGGKLPPFLDRRPGRVRQGPRVARGGGGAEAAAPRGVSARGRRREKVPRASRKTSSNVPRMPRSSCCRTRSDAAGSRRNERPGERNENETRDDRQHTRYGRVARRRARR